MSDDYTVTHERVHWWDPLAQLVEYTVTPQTIFDLHNQLRKVQAQLADKETAAVPPPLMWERIEKNRWYTLDEHTLTWMPADEYRLKQRATAAEAEVKELRAERSRLAGIVQDLNDQLANGRPGYWRLVEQRDELQKRVESQGKEIAVLRTDLAKAEFRVRQEVDGYRNLQERVESQGKEIAELDNSCDKYKRAYEKLRGATMGVLYSRLIPSLFRTVQECDKEIK